MTVKNLPFWHPIRTLHRNPSFDTENTFLFELFSGVRRPSRWERLKAFFRREFSPLFATRTNDQ